MIRTKWFGFRCRAALLAAAATFCSTWAHAQAAIESVKGVMQGGTEMVRIELSQPLGAVPSGFAIQAPPASRWTSPTPPTGRASRWSR